MRVLTPAEGMLRGLEMGAPWEAITPDSVVDEAGGFVVYLPQPIQGDGVKRLRLRLETALYNAAGEIAAEVFARGQAGFPQLVVAGDVSEAGRHAVLWDGRDQSGRLVGPGLYLVRVAVETDRQREERMACVAVVY